jgi:hypothetical protein
MHWLQQFSPLTFTDEHDTPRVPETIGYVDPNGNANTGGALPVNLIARAQANLAVRDGWAGMYFHWMLDPSLLNQLITGVKALGYQYVQTSQAIAQGN